MTPDNKDVAGLLPSGWKLTHVSDRYVLQKPGEGSAVFDIEDSSVRVAVAAMFFRDLLAAPGAAIAAREQEVPPGKRERMAFYEAQMKDPANHAALSMEMAYLRHKDDASREKAPVASGKVTIHLKRDPLTGEVLRADGPSPSGAGLGGKGNKS